MLSIDAAVVAEATNSASQVPKDHESLAMGAARIRGGHGIAAIVEVRSP
ncbi:MAG: hypothetical protein HY791_36890 [Deltaproteobacteria bacterium]|nr:hypothetical protein [Deltaproteobacteria bacterium]